MWLLKTDWCEIKRLRTVCLPVCPDCGDLCTVYTSAEKKKVHFRDTFLFSYLLAYIFLSSIRKEQFQFDWTKTNPKPDPHLTLIDRNGWSLFIRQVYNQCMHFILFLPWSLTALLVLPWLLYSETVISRWPAVKLCRYFENEDIFYIYIRFAASRPTQYMSLSTEKKH